MPRPAAPAPEHLPPDDVKSAADAIQTALVDLFLMPSPEETVRRACIAVRDIFHARRCWMHGLPLAYDPGSEERYNDGTYYMLSRIAEKVSGMPTDAFLWKEMLYPMGFSEAAFSHCPLGHVIGGSGLYISGPDYAKFGELYRTGGVWKGRRILTEEWVKTVLEMEYVFEWDDTRVLYFKGGMYGQKIIVHPGQKRVVAMQSYGGDSGAVMGFVRGYEE